MKNLILITIVLFSFAASGQRMHLVKDGEIVSSRMTDVFTRDDGTFIYGGYGNLPDSVHYADGWRPEVRPEFNPDSARLGQRYFNPAMDAVTWVVVSYTTEEMAARKSAELDAKDSEWDPLAVKRLLQKTVEKTVNFDSLSTQEYEDLTTIYPRYRPGVAYKAGDRIVVNDSLLYMVINPHTSQKDWDPTIEESLYVIVPPPGVIAEWRQRTGVPLGDGKYDAYMTGDRVLFEGSTWESKIDVNTWSPSQYPAGWLLIE